MASRKEERENKVCTAIRQLVDDCDSETTTIKTRWRDNYDMFVNGTQSPEKEDWQVDVSLNKYQTSIRAAQGRLVNILVQNQDWYELAPRTNNPQAEVLAPAFQKVMDYYLESANFKRHAGSFFLSSLISSGSMYVGWKARLVQNPEFIVKKTEKARQDQQRRLAKNVANPQVESDDSLSGSELESSLLSALDDFVSEAQGDTVKEPKIAPFVQIGCLDLKDVNHEKQYWDPNVMYMEDSLWRAFKYDVKRYELNNLAKMGFIPRSAVKRVGPRTDSAFTRRTNDKIRYNNTMAGPRSREDIVELTYYVGPLIIDNEIVNDKYYALIANDTTILLEGDYPFWEPPGHNTSIITAAVKQIPYRATGAGIGDSAVAIQKLYDSNWQLVCDQFRFGISGINVVNYSALVDKSQLAEGVYPGMTLQVRDEPKKAFDRISLTNNLENQASPVQAKLEEAIDSLTGINEMMTGGNNQYSRTPAAETNARLQAGQQNVNIIALDLEQNFLIPFLQKAWARVLQFGLPEIASNPELSALLSEDELYEIQQLNAGSRLEILNQWYKFKIKGFSGTQDKNEQAQRNNEFLQVIGSNPLFSQLVDAPELLKKVLRDMGMKEPEKLLLTDTSPIMQIMAENRLLLSSHMVMPGQADDHQLHLQMQGPLAQSPYGTPELQQHVMMHQQAVQMMQQAAATQGGNQNVQ